MRLVSRSTSPIGLSAARSSARNVARSTKHSTACANGKRHAAAAEAIERGGVEMVEHHRARCIRVKVPSRVLRDERSQIAKQGLYFGILWLVVLDLFGRRRLTPGKSRRRIR